MLICIFALCKQRVEITFWLLCAAHILFAVNLVGTDPGVEVAREGRATLENEVLMCCVLSNLSAHQGLTRVPSRASAAKVHRLPPLCSSREQVVEQDVSWKTLKPRVEMFNLGLQEASGTGAGSAADARLKVCVPPATLLAFPKPEALQTARDSRWDCPLQPEPHR